MRPVWLCLYLLVAVSAAASGDEKYRRVKRIVGGGSADPPPKIGASEKEKIIKELAKGERKPQVLTGKDKKVAVVNGVKNKDGIQSFLGIRYAEPPVKNLRFQRPKRTHLEGTVDAKKYGPPCPQRYNGRVIGQEDCLFLNVYTPQVPSEGGSPTYPVLIWIHGGNFKTGSAAQYLPTEIVKKGVVVVTIQYRLGSLGFLSLKKDELPGNVGMFDIASAVLWVRDYIEFFGGDNNRITASGQGSGASCASLLAFNKLIKENIHGVFAMSGTPVSPFTQDENEVETSNEVAQLDGCDSHKEAEQFVSCMQKLPLETILNGDDGVEGNRNKKFNYAKKLSNLLTPGPVEEGEEDNRFLPYFSVESPLEALQNGHFPEIPLLTGVTKKETGAGVKVNFLDQLKKVLNPSFLKGGLLKDCLHANTGMFVNKTVNPGLDKLFNTGEYIKSFSSIVSSALSDVDQVVKHTTDAFFNLPAFITSHLWSQKNNVYLYSFEHESKPMADKFLKDISLVPKSQTSNEKKEPGHGDDLIYLFDLQTLEGKPLTHTSKLSDNDKKVRDQFTTIVAEFVKTGTPKTKGGETWTPFKKDEGAYMVINENPKMSKGFNKCSMGLWTGDTNMLNSVECGLAQASKVVKDTLGDAGTQILNTVGNVRGKFQEAFQGATSGILNRFSGPFQQHGGEQPSSTSNKKKGSILSLPFGLGK